MLASVKLQSGITPYFSCNTGVRQVCVLIPWLFSIQCLTVALSQKSPEREGKVFKSVWIVRISSLLFADDLVIISDTARGQHEQSKLQILEHFL